MQGVGSGCVFNFWAKMIINTILGGSFVEVSHSISQIPILISKAPVLGLKAWV